MAGGKVLGARIISMGNWECVGTDTTMFLCHQNCLNKTHAMTNKDVMVVSSFNSFLIHVKQMWKDMPQRSMGRDHYYWTLPYLISHGFNIFKICCFFVLSDLVYQTNLLIIHTWDIYSSCSIYPPWYYFIDHLY